jgi:hypothetical protein
MLALALAACSVPGPIDPAQAQELTNVRGAIMVVSKDRYSNYLPGRHLVNRASTPASGPALKRSMHASSAHPATDFVCRGVANVTTPSAREYSPRMCTCDGRSGGVSRIVTTDFVIGEFAIDEVV